MSPKINSKHRRLFFLSLLGTLGVKQIGMLFSLSGVLQISKQNVPETPRAVNGTGRTDRTFVVVVAAAPTSVCNSTNCNGSNSRTRFKNNTVEEVIANSSIVPQTIAPTPRQEPTPLLRNLNASQITDFFERQPLRYEQIPHFFPKPSTNDSDMVAIYSQSAWSKLHDMLNTGNATLFVSGGSSMAGAGEVVTEDRCHNLLANLLHNVTVFDRAIGGRNSLHVANYMHSLFPAHADILLWEFAINDAHIGGGRQREEQINLLYLFLEGVVRVAKERHQEPPLTILLYLWNTPFQVSSGKVPQFNFESHRHFAEHYPFVVGQVNAARYMESWQLDEGQAKAVAIADLHHPNTRGHMILAYLLHDFVTNEQRREKPKEVNGTKPAYTWLCGDDAAEKRLLRDVMVNRQAVASYTGDEPKNKDLLPGMLNPLFINTTLAILGKSDPIRQDRHYVQTIPCCSVVNITIDVSTYSPLQGIMIKVQPTLEVFQLFVDGEDVTGRIISTGNWTDCHNPFNYVAFERERPVSEIAMCNSAPNCGGPNSTILHFMGVSVYGRKLGQQS